VSRVGPYNPAPAVSTLIDADTIKNYAGADLHCAGAFEKFWPLATPFQTVMLPNVTTYLGCAVALWAAHAPRSNPVAIAKRMKKRGKYMAIGPMVFLSGR
jgi:hypothetical protein